MKKKIKIVLFNILIIAICLIFGLNFNATFKSNSFFLYAFLVITIFLFIIHLFILKKYRKILSICLYTQLFIIIVFIFINSFIEYKRIDNLKTKGSPVVEAIIEYRKMNSSDPKTLQELLPEFIKSLPATEPLIGYNDIYGLSYIGSSWFSNYWILTYDFDTGEWIEVYTDE